MRNTANVYTLDGVTFTSSPLHRIRIGRKANHWKVKQNGKQNFWAHMPKWMRRCEHARLIFNYKSIWFCKVCLKTVIPLLHVNCTSRVQSTLLEIWNVEQSIVPLQNIYQVNIFTKFWCWNCASVWTEKKSLSHQIVVEKTMIHCF